ncbi:hypothetical protein [Paenibacillus sp. y28]|uniref:hypothetical protein n=1 Tax=Paenibacillus sp. y28 TaxID=3129110 RepID=UPI0030169A32
MSILLMILLAVAMLVLILGAVYSVRNRQKRTTVEDKDPPRTMVKHPLLANPVLWIYAAFAVIVLIVAAFYNGMLS